MTDKPISAEEQACCACLRVKYDPLPVGGNMMTERWVCEDCGTPFVRFAKLRAAERAVEKRVREECLKIAERYSKQEHEDVDSCGSSIMYYSDLIAAAIRALPESEK
jgi:hypothetical protein